jgi:phosphate starvation-inducible protein PhoH and related proteins
MRRKAEGDKEKEVTPKTRKPFHLEFKNTAQKIAWMAFEQHDILFLLGPAGVGKSHLAVAFAISELLNRKKKKIMLTRPIVEAGEKLGYLPGPQPLDAKILTPNGWTTMGELKIGDMVISRNGKPTKVINIFPKGKKMVYKIYTTENTSTEACEDHLWLTRTFEDRKRNRSGSIKSTKEIMENLIKNDKINHFLPRNEPIEFNKRDLPLSPYVLGALLGDGCMTDSVCLASIDEEIINRVDKELNNLNCNLTAQNKSINYHVKAKLKSNKPARKVRFTNIDTGIYEDYSSISVACEKIKMNKGTLSHRCRNSLVVDKQKYEFLPLEKRWANPIKNILESLNLLGKKANQKFIPEIYKYSSIQDRIDLLRGLMDTDGSVKKTGEASFTTTSKQLARDVVELVQSLGGRAVLRQRNRKNRFTSINGRIITSKYTPYEFTISLPNNINPFYLPRKAKNFKNKYIHSVGIKSIEPVCEKEVQCIIVDNDEHLYITDQYIVTHNTFEEKINPYLMPVFDVMDRMVGKESAERERINKCMEIAPMAYLRGRTFHDSVCILDEAQNASEEQLKLYLTRLGEDSKIIITGDASQSDLKGDDKYALSRVVESMKVVPGIGVIEFSEENIVRHPLVAAILKAWPTK